MRKKWTYVAVACMLLGTAPVFTGCIDTDEPAGLEDLRGAKSELLRAKAAVEAAKVAEVEAQAALLQAQAKVEEANAVKVQAEAEKIKAEAAIAQAKADYINAKTEEAKAEAQAVIDENERKKAEWEANAAVRQAKAEAAIKEAELKTAAALAKYQMVIAALQKTQDRVLAPYKQRLQWTTTAYYKALDELRQAQIDYNDQAAVVEEREAYYDLYTRKYQKKVILKTNAYNGAVAAVEDVNARIEEAAKLQPSELSVKYKEVLEEQNTIRKEIADLSVEAAEKMVEIWNTQKIPLINMWKEYVAMKNEPQEIAEVKFDFDAAGYPAYVRGGSVTLPESEYMYSNDAEYKDRVKALECWLKVFESWRRDENDDAWTNQTLVELNGQAKELQDEIAKLQAEWQEAVDAYRTGEYMVTDPSKITGYDDVAEAVADFNEEAKKYNEVATTVKTLKDQKEADEKTKTDAIKTAQEKAKAARSEADKTKETSLENAETLVKERAEALKQTQSSLNTQLSDAQKALGTSTDPEEIEELLERITTLQDQLQTVADQIASNTIDAFKEEIEEAYADAIQTANTTEIEEIAKANEAYNKKWAETGTETAKLNTAESDRKTAAAEMKKALEPIKTAAKTFNSNVPELTGALLPISDTVIDALDDPNAETGLVDANVAATDIIALSPESLKKVIKIRSNELFGPTFESNVYGDNLYRLEPMTTEDVAAEVEKQMADIYEADDPDFYQFLTYKSLCLKYGKVGNLLALQVQAEMAESYLTNSELIESTIAQAEIALNTLTSNFETLEESIKAKCEEYELAQEKMLADMEDTLTPIEAKRLELVPMDGLLTAIESAMRDYWLAGEAVWSEESIAWYQKILKYQKECLEIKLFEAETDLQRAQYNLDMWNKDELDLLEEKQQAVEAAQIKVDRWKAEVDKVQAELDAVIANLTASPIDSTTTEE